MFCFLYRKGKPKVTVTRSGTMAVLSQNCRECGRCFQWRSQPLVLGKYPAGNILLSFGILMVGASVSRVMLVLRHMGLAVFSLKTYFLHQRKFLFPVVLHYWEEYQSRLSDPLKGIPGAVWSGHGRFDSMGHSAKYGTYTMFACDLIKIVHFDLLQVGHLHTIKFSPKCKYHFLTVRVSEFHTIIIFLPYFILGLLFLIQIRIACTTVKLNCYKLECCCIISRCVRLL